ncbi:MAG TPA: methyltransferase domain-containing protein, partial [Oligoflexia bacterium]|nr:methyltransferase domain-containing protein [Oligoflexia bacterium]
MPDELKNKNLQVISARMREEWDRRVSHDYRYWMSDGVDSDRTMWEAGKRDFSILIKELDPTELARQTALEIGCGVGRLMRPAAQVFSRAIGIDVSAEAIAQAKCLLADLPNVDLILGNGVDLVQIAQHSIDFAFTFAAMSSMPVAVIANYLSELSRVVKPNGLLRLQVFLGREQDTAEEDTLAIRVFTKARFCEALHAAGFAVEYATELELPFEVSNHEEGIIAHIVSARRMAGIFAVSSDVQQHLVERSESAAGAAWQGSRTEYLMALARAKQQLDAGQAQQALAALEFAVAVYAQAEPDVRELLAELRRLTGAVNAGHQHGPTAASMRNEVSAHSQHAPVYAQNLEILRRRFPELESLLEKTVLTEAVSVSFSAAGEPVISCQGLALSHR